MECSARRQDDTNVAGGDKAETVHVLPARQCTCVLRGACTSAQAGASCKQVGCGEERKQRVEAAHCRHGTKSCLGASNPPAEARHLPLHFVTCAPASASAAARSARPRTLHLRFGLVHCIFDGTDPHLQAVRRRRHRRRGCWGARGWAAAGTLGARNVPLSPTYCRLHTWPPKLSQTNSDRLLTLLNLAKLSGNSASSDIVVAC